MNTVTPFILDIPLKDKLAAKIVLRLHELLRAAVKTGKAKGMKWVKVLVTAHDYDLIYKAS